MGGGVGVGKNRTKMEEWELDKLKEFEGRIQEKGGSLWRRREG